MECSITDTSKIASYLQSDFPHTECYLRPTPAQYWIPAIEMSFQLKHIPKVETKAGYRNRKLREKTAITTKKVLKEFLSSTLHHKLEERKLEKQRIIDFKNKGGLRLDTNLKQNYERVFLRHLDPQTFQSQKMEGTYMQCFTITVYSKASLKK